MPVPRSRSVVPLFALGVSLVAALAAQQDESQQQPPPLTFRGNINFVRVDAIVTDDDDRPITDLEEADFEVREDGKPQMIEQFKVIRIEKSTEQDPKPIRDKHDEEAEAARDDVRLFAIYLGSSIRSRETERAREALIKFVRTQLYPSDMIAIVEPQSLEEIWFSRDHEAIARRLRRLTDPFLLENSSTPGPGQAARRPAPGQFMPATRALEELAIRLSTLRDGRKSIIYVGNSIGSSRGDLTLDFYELITTLNRTNTSVYVMDTGGLTTRSNLGRTINMRALAEQTGGFAIVNTNNFDANLVTVARDATHYYLLGYTSPASSDGKFHPIEVRVKRKGANVRSRSGYLAFTPQPVSSPFPKAPEAAPPVKTALATIERPLTSARLVETWIGTTPGDQGRARVTFVWDAASTGIGGAASPVRYVSVVASDSASETVFSTPEPDASLSLDTAAARGVTFQSAPGRLQLRVTVFGRDGDVIDRETKLVDVPDFSLPRTSFGVPRVFRARSARDVRLIAADPAALPVATRTFARTDRLLVRVDRLESTPATKAALLNRLGQVMMELPVTALDAEPAEQVELNLNSLAAGEYLVEISATPDGTDTKALVPFRIR